MTTAHTLVRGITRDILKIIKSSDEALALRVEEEMARAGVDFSECTMREFTREALIAYKVVLLIDLDRAEGGAA
jgi:hypothetical protein